LDALYEKQGTATALRGQHCQRCDRVAFPPNPYGCEHCGASGEALETRLLAGRGRLLAFVDVNRAVRPNVAVPYTVGSIALEDGPVIRALMNSDPAPLAVDAQVEGELIQIADGDAPQLRFRTMEAA
jgi:uncharacterized OB-fold protein